MPFLRTLAIFLLGLTALFTGGCAVLVLVFSGSGGGLPMLLLAAVCVGCIVLIKRLREPPGTGSNAPPADPPDPKE